MSEDGPDPFESILRANLERLRATPDAPAVERRLGLVERLGHRRRQRRALARGGAFVVVVAILLMSAVSAIGRVEGASDRDVQLGGRPPSTSRVDVGPGTSLVAGEQPVDETTTTTSTSPIGPVDDRSREPASAGPTVTRPASPSTSSTTMPAPSTSTTWTPGFGVDDALVAPPVAGCLEYDEVAISTVMIRWTGAGAGVPQCHRVARAGQLTFVREPNFAGGIALDVVGTEGTVSGAILAKLNTDEPVVVGPVSAFVASGHWVQFKTQAYGGVPYADIYVLAV